jgi:hypothetical protein
VAHLGLHEIHESLGIVSGGHVADILLLRTKGHLEGAGEEKGDKRREGGKVPSQFGFCSERSVDVAETKIILPKGGREGGRERRDKEE